MSALIPAPVDYTDLDFPALDARLLQLFQSIQSLSHIDIANKAEGYRVLLDANAHVGDRLAYLINRVGREGQLLTASQRRSILALVKATGYRPPGAAAAQVTLTWTLPETNAKVVTVKAGSLIGPPDRTNDVRFRVLADAVIPIGQLSVTTVAEHSEAWEDDNFASNDRPDQVFLLSRTPYVDGSLTVSTAGGTWTEVRNFLSSTSSDRHFVTLIDAQDRCRLRFGNGRNGAIPAGTISTSYRIGGGLVGNLPAGTLTAAEGTPVVDSSNVPVRYTVTNLLDAEGGDDRQSNAMIKLLAPEQVRVPASTVAREDYEIVARSVSGVARALMLVRRQDPSVLPGEGFLYVVPTTGGTASDTLLSAVAAKFGDEVLVGSAVLASRFPKGAKPKTVTMQLRVRAAVYRTLDIVVKVFPQSSFTTPAGLLALASNIRASLGELFAIMVDASTIDPTGETTGLIPNPRIDFGYYLKDSDGNASAILPYQDIVNTIHDTAGVLRIPGGGDAVRVNGGVDDIQLALREFPKLGTVTVIDARTSTLLP